MKFLTLNTHSWMEKEAEEKFQLLLQDILDKDYDLICFQEINQEMTSPEVEVNNHYQALHQQNPFIRITMSDFWSKNWLRKGKTTTGLGLTIMLAMTATMKA